MNQNSIFIRLQGRTGACAAVSRRELTRSLEQILKRFGLAGYGVDLLLTDDRTITALNRRFLGLAGPTNVLSFPEVEASSEKRLGQICLSVDTLFREARLYAQDPASHLIRLLSHGVLHLAGYAHGRRMQEMTDLGVQVFEDRAEKHLLLGQAD